MKLLFILVIAASVVVVAVYAEKSESLIKQTTDLLLTDRLQSSTRGMTSSQVL